MVSTHRYCHARRQPTRGALTGGVQVERGDVQEPGRTLIAMNTTYGTPAGGYRQPPGRSFFDTIPQEAVVPLGRWHHPGRLPRRRRDRPGGGVRRRDSGGQPGPFQFRQHFQLAGGRAELRAQRPRPAMRPLPRPASGGRWAGCAVSAAWTGRRLPSTTRPVSTRSRSSGASSSR